MAATTLMSLPTEPSALLASAPRMVGRFSIRAEIGRGSNGVVYSAFDPVLSREVAIKAIPLTHDRKWSERIEANFLNEAKAAAGMNHPHIVTVFDAGKTDSLAYLAMERLHGRDLHEVIVAGQHFSPRQVASLMLRVADAVHFAHKRGLIHRDIKPSNIFIQRDGKPKVLDFGVALANLGETSTERRQLIGTPNYMSPEQALGRKLDARSDVFSIGTILYELLAGRRAFDGSTIDETLAQVISDAPATLDPQKTNIPPRLIDICNKALEKDIEKRYQSAGDLRNDLAAFAGQPSTNAANQSSYGTLGGSRAMLMSLGDLLWRRATPRTIAIAVVAAVLITAWFALGDNAPAPTVAEVTTRASIAPVPTPIITEPAPVVAPPPETHGAPVEAPKAPRKAARVTRTETSSAQMLASAEGFVTLAVAPWGEVFVDGATRGVSPPLNRLALPSGTHVIEVRNGSAPPFSARVEIKPGQTLNLQHRF
jgi:serine/threonine-protein kinase